MEFKIGTLLTVHSGLVELSAGYDKIIKDGSSEKVVKAAYIMSGRTRLALAQAMGAMAGPLATYDEARIGLIRQYSGGANEIKPSDAGWTDFQREIADVLAASIELEFPSVQAADLKLDENPIPIATVTALLPILKDS